MGTLRCGKTSKKTVQLVEFVTLLQNEFNSDVARFTILQK